MLLTIIVINSTISFKGSFGETGSYMENVPEDSYRTWTIFKTSEKMKIECNGVNVWEIAFLDVSSGCAEAFASDSTSMLFNEGTPVSAAMFYKAAGKCEQSDKLNMFEQS